jgi:hypothetical protein
LKGRGQFSAEWMLVAQKFEENSRWILKPMNFCLNHFGNGTIEITKQGNFKMGQCKEKAEITEEIQQKCYNLK